MRHTFNRRDVLTWGLGMAACWVGRGLPRLQAAEPGRANHICRPISRPRRRACPWPSSAANPTSRGLLRSTLDRGPGPHRRDPEAGQRQDGHGEDQRDRAGRGRLAACPATAPITCIPHMRGRAVRGAGTTPAPGGSSSSRASIRPQAPEEVLTGGGWDVEAIQSAGGQRVTLRGHPQPRPWPGLQPAHGPLGRVRLSGLRPQPALREDRRVRLAGQAQGPRQRRA